MHISFCSSFFTQEDGEESDWKFKKERPENRQYEKGHPVIHEA